MCIRDSITINEVIIGFGFVPPKKRYKQPQIQSVKVDGLTMGNFSDACEQVGRINTYRDEIITQCTNALRDLEIEEERIREVEAENESLSEEISNKSEELAILQTSVALLNKQKADAQVSIDGIQSKENTLNVKIQNLDDSLDKKVNQSSNLNSEISEKQSQLKNLKDDINQFPAEFSAVSYTHLTLPTIYSV